MKTGIINRYGRCGPYRQGDVVFTDPTNRAMRRLLAKQTAQTNEGRRPRPSPTGYISSTTKEKE